MKNGKQETRLPRPEEPDRDAAQQVCAPLRRKARRRPPAGTAENRGKTGVQLLPVRSLEQGACGLSNSGSSSRRFSLSS